MFIYFQHQFCYCFIRLQCLFTFNFGFVIVWQGYNVYLLSTPVLLLFHKASMFIYFQLQLCYWLIRLQCLLTYNSICCFIRLQCLFTFNFNVCWCFRLAMFINLPYYLLFQGYNVYLLSTSMFVVVSDLLWKTASPVLHLAKPWQLALLLVDLATLKEQVDQHPQVVTTNFYPKL